MLLSLVPEEIEVNIDFDHRLYFDSILTAFAYINNNQRHFNWSYILSRKKMIFYKKGKAKGLQLMYPGSTMMQRMLYTSINNYKEWNQLINAKRDQEEQKR